MDQSLNKAIIFDFDGTLVDSEKAIYHCFQRITNCIAPERISYAKNILIGPPLRQTASGILGPNHQDQLDEFVKLFIEMHDENTIDNTNPYPGVNEILQHLSSMKIPMAISTNKRQAPTIKLVEHFGWLSFFELIECSDSKPNLRDKFKMIKDIKNSNDRFENAYFVGDTVNDGNSANQHNLKFVRALYGYGSNQDWSNVDVNRDIKIASDLKSLINV